MSWSGKPGPAGKIETTDEVLNRRIKIGLPPTQGGYLEAILQSKLLMQRLDAR